MLQRTFCTIYVNQNTMKNEKHINRYMYMAYTLEKRHSSRCYQRNLNINKNQFIIQIFLSEEITLIFYQNLLGEMQKYFTVGHSLYLQSKNILNASLTTATRGRIRCRFGIFCCLGWFTK